ncbi:VRR-NUC domain-containing protein [Methanobacterium lacus]|uniref:VRR-NUC domain-containing protein n=1 Tax=Methanobacterium lacus (strain AL-21) TaxID=877455 RepID=F0T5W0_METLA|nr:VRR-NUC domain-containing protein [Methanobacterium lacus]ADZ09353.1 VRR-NUC domain-containing protein [Methanobacterium lacus]
MISLTNINLTREKSPRRGKAKYLLGNGIWGLTAEESAKDYYESLGYKARNTENQFWQSFMIFFLWDNKIEGKISVNEKIDYLKSKNLENYLIQSHNEHFINTFDGNYKYSRYTDRWDHYLIEDYLIPLKFIEKEKLLEFIKRLAFKNTGLPDLIVYNEENFFFSEVKSENDRISDDQFEWHMFLSEKLNLNVEILLINNSQKKIENIKNRYQKCGFHI